MSKTPISLEEITKLYWERVGKPQLEQQITQYNYLAERFGWEKIERANPNG